MPALDLIFLDSYNRIITGHLHLRTRQGFYDAFYGRFTSHSLSIAEKFKTVDMERQKAALRESLLHVVQYFGTGVPSESLAKVAQSHGKAGINIRPHYYFIWLECLIATVREYDPQFSDDVEDSWRRVCSKAIDYMIDNYNRSAKAS